MERVRIRQIKSPPTSLYDYRIKTGWLEVKPIGGMRAFTFYDDGKPMETVVVNTK